MNGHPEYLRILEERKQIHLEKSGGYGNPADPFANFTAVAALTGLPAWVYPMLRAQEKLARCWSLYEQGRVDELGEEFTDISSLLDCAEALRRQGPPTTREQPCACVSQRSRCSCSSQSSAAT